MIIDYYFITEQAGEITALLRSSVRTRGNCNPESIIEIRASLNLETGDVL